MVPDLETITYNMFLEQGIDSAELEAFSRSGLYEFLNEHYILWKEGVKKRLEKGTKSDAMGLVKETIENDTPKTDRKDIYETLKSINGGYFALAVEINYFPEIMLNDAKRKRKMLDIVAQVFIDAYIEREKAQEDYRDDDDLETAYN